MDIIIKTLKDAIQINLAYVILMEIVVSLLFLIKIWLGTILGTKSEGFDFKKFLSGILKALNFIILILALCYTLNLFTCVLNVIGQVEIKVEVITTLEVLAILIVWGLDLSKDIIEKIKSIKELKYVKYEDVIVTERNEAQSE